MGEVKDEIKSAIKTLGLSGKDIKLLDDATGEKVFTDCLNYFVKSGDRRWWWEDFKQRSFSFQETDKPFELLNDIIPETKGNVWLIVEDDNEPYYPVYDTKPEIIKDIIGQCFAFEYYIIDKNKEWLICENHHNRLIGVGDKLRERNIGNLRV